MEGLAAPMASEVHTLLVDPVHDDILYAGTSGGIAKSTDGGISWRPSNSGLANATSRQLQLLHPSLPRYMWEVMGAEWRRAPMGARAGAQSMQASRVASLGT